LYVDKSNWCPALNAWVRVIAERTLFGIQTAKVIIEGTNQVYTVPFDSLRPDREFDLPSALSVVAGARIWQALGSDLFLAPLVSKVLPLPHQFRVLRKALANSPVRMMLADEVGMGKTIEAGLILKELKLRGQIERILILAPKSLLLQWVVEMETLFGENFDLVLPGNWGIKTTLRGDNLWKRQKQVVTSIDSVKPKEGQRGWTHDKIERYNVERFHDLIGAGWDLVIIDESHKVAGASEDVSRYELAKELGKAVPHLLLLSATPHSGKSDAFRRLLSLLDPASFKTGAPLTKDIVETVVIRTEKRTATDAEGNPLFSPRLTRLISVPFEARHALQQKLYEDVSEYVIEGYNKALRTGDKGSRLLLILIQRLMSSSTHAISQFLSRRVEALRGGEATDQPPSDEIFAGDSDYDELAQGVLFLVEASKEELRSVERLLELAIRVENSGPDARTEALYEQMIQLAQEDNEPSKKFIIFTEFTATQEILRDFLEARGYPVATLNGSMEISERKAALEAFREEAQVLISTDAGGEGLNMQFAHVVFNYDLPWNPMRVEQRIGRVDRIGQKRTVKALNLVLENSVEARLYEIWQQKLATILEEFGVDKTGDVLDSSEAGIEFEKLARTALLNPTALDDEFDRLVTEIRKTAEKALQTQSLYSSEIQEADVIPNLPLQAWLSTLVGSKQSLTASENSSLSEQIIAEINALAPYFAEGKPVPHLKLSGLGFPLDGWFSVWKVGIADGQWRQQHVFPLFANEQGETFSRSAQRLWDEMATRQVTIDAAGETSEYKFSAMQALAENEAQELFSTLVTQTQNRARHRLSMLEYSYLARRTLLTRIGLEAVRETRRQELDREYQQRKTEMETLSETLPELECLFAARITAQ
jgi:superfamily II DNA or RNA helicase